MGSEGEGEGVPGAVDERGGVRVFDGDVAVGDTGVVGGVASGEVADGVGAGGSVRGGRLGRWWAEGGWMFWVVMGVAAFVRLWRLADLPPGIFRDEAEKALNGWFLWRGGVDASGRPWPVFIQVFGVTTSAIYQYAVVPFVAVLGLNEWSARLPAACVGVATVGVTWALAGRLWGRWAAVAAAGLLAISPWHVPLSRWAQQGVFLPLAFVVAAWGVAVFLGRCGGRDGELFDTKTQRHEGVDADAAGQGGLWGRRDACAPREGLPREGSLEVGSGGGVDGGGGVGWRKGFGLLLAGGALGVAVYAYDPARLFAPLLALWALVIWWRVWMLRWRWVLGGLVVFGLVAAPVVWLMATQGRAAQARFEFLSIFQPGTPVGVALGRFLANYFSHFGAGFLFVTGDGELRHGGGVGVLNGMEGLFVFVGAVMAIWRRDRWGVFLLGWVLLAPVAASLTRVGVPHALRSQVALPAVQLLAAFGMVQGAGLLRGEAGRRLFGQVVVLGVLVGALPFFLSYFGGYAARSAFNWQFGVKQALEMVEEPGLAEVPVYLHNVVGAEYLVPFYLGWDRGEFVKLMAGGSRFRLMPFEQPGRPSPVVEGRGVFISPPGYEWQAGSAVVPISYGGGAEGAVGAGAENSGPVLLVVFNPELSEWLTQRAQ